MSTTTSRPATCLKAYASPPRLSEASSRTWITRGGNFVVAISEVTAGAVLERDDNPDEYMMLLAGTGATVAAGGELIEAESESLTIVPPGASRITTKGPGHVVRVLSDRCVDFAAEADNAAVYAGGAKDVVPLVPWPAPPGGYKLRNYKPFSYDKPETNMRVFRCTNLMMNVITKRTAPRDTTKLSPHAHEDFDQASLLLEGDYIHHMRYPWTADLAEWRDDEQIAVGSPSVLVIPPKAIHTSRNVGTKRSWLIDIFAPPRVDFSKRGLVLNADDYPMPAGT